MEKALNQILQASQVVYAEVQDRISPIRRDDGEKSITYELTGNPSPMFASGKTSSMKTSDFAIIARAATYKDTKAIANAIKSTLDGIRGLFCETQIHLTVFNSEQQNQYIEQELTEITLNYTFHHN